MADFLGTIASFWQARKNDDKPAMHALLAPRATYSLAGVNDFTDMSAKDALEALVGLFHFHDLKPMTTVVDGLKVAMVNRIRVSYRDGDPVDSEVCDLWEFDEAGKIVSLKQFADTDMIRKMVGGAA